MKDLTVHEWLIVDLLRESEAKRTATAGANGLLEADGLRRALNTVEAERDQLLVDMAALRDGMTDTVVKLTSRVSDLLLERERIATRLRTYRDVAPGDVRVLLGDILSGLSGSVSGPGTEKIGG